MKHTRRGLFGLLAGAAAAPLVKDVPVSDLPTASTVQEAWAMIANGWVTRVAVVCTTHRGIDPTKITLVVGGRR